MARFEVLELNRAADAAYNLLREKILNGELAPGERLDVGQVAEEMGVSRTPVKDALQKLSAQGLITIHARKGTFVTQVKPEDLEETFEVREALELKACELLAGKLDNQKAKALREMNEKMKNSELTRRGQVLLNHEFHWTLVEYAGNSRLLHLYSDLSAHLVMARIHPRYDDWKGPLPDVLKDHEDIIEGLTDSRVEEAQRILSRHIRTAKERLLSRITQVETSA